MSFTELGLHPHVLKCLESTGYETPTEVQRQSIPAAMAGQDLLVSSHTGSGKTAAFLLPSLSRLAETPEPVEGAPTSNGPRLLVLCPTRELALQVQKQVTIYGKGIRRLKSVCLVGGAPFGPQFQALKVNPEVMIATPGRLIDHLERGRIDFSRLEVLVLDEADRMLDMGFIEDIENIVSRTPDSRQTLLFSATLDGAVGKLAREMTRNPQRIEVATQQEHKANIDQRLLYTDDIGHKHRLLDYLLRDAGMTQAVVFAATKRSTEDLAEILLAEGFSAAALHGDMPQHKRNRTLQRLRDGTMQVLVATDVAARGIDVAGISHVINFDAPRQAEDYVHRIGRTGRAGRTGIAYTFIQGGERGLVREIERYTGEKIPVEVIPGLEPKTKPDREPPRKSRADWQGKPRGGWQNKPYSGKFPGLDRKPEAALYADRPRGDRPYGERNGGARGDARPPRAVPRHDAGRAVPKVEAWMRQRPPQPSFLDYVEPEFAEPVYEKEPDANAWQRTAVERPDAWKKGNSWGKRPAGVPAGASKPAIHHATPGVPGRKPAARGHGHKPGGGPKRIRHDG